MSFLENSPLTFNKTINSKKTLNDAGFSNSNEIIDSVGEVQENLYVFLKDLTKNNNFSENEIIEIITN